MFEAPGTWNWQHHIRMFEQPRERDLVELVQERQHLIDVGAVVPTPMGTDIRNE